MHLHLVYPQEATSSIDGLAAALSELDHRVERTCIPSETVTEAAALGHDLAGAWRVERPDAGVAIGGLAGPPPPGGRRGLPGPGVHPPFAPGRGGGARRRPPQKAGPPAR